MGISNNENLCMCVCVSLSVCVDVLLCLIGYSFECLVGL